MSVTLCQYTVGGLCCICTSGCLQAPTICAGGGNFSTNCCVVSTCLYTNGICQCGAGNINSNCCILGQVICGIQCVQGTCVCAAGGNLASNCCVVAPIHCATTCFVGNGSGLTNLPSSGGMTLICSVCMPFNTPVSGAYMCQVFSSSYTSYLVVFDGITTGCTCCGICTGGLFYNFLEGSSNTANCCCKYNGNFMTAQICTLCFTNATTYGTVQCCGTAAYLPSNWGNYSNCGGALVGSMQITAFDDYGGTIGNGGYVRNYYTQSTAGNNFGWTQGWHTGSCCLTGIYFSAVCKISGKIHIYGLS